MSYNMIPQQPLIRQWRGRMVGPVNHGLRMGQPHNRNVSLGTINGSGSKNGGRGRHFPNATMPGNMFRTPAGVLFNPMPGYGGKNANNKAQPYQVCGVVCGCVAVMRCLVCKCDSVFLPLLCMYSNFLSSMVQECRQLTG